MNCDLVQEKLSVFLDREGNADDFDGVLSHLYGCEQCQSFFNLAVKFRSLAQDRKLPYPDDLDDTIVKKMRKEVRSNPLRYHLRLPVYAVSAAAVILLVLSFTFGFTMQEDVHQRELNAVLKAPPSQVVYGMPTQVVYPVSMREPKGGMR